MQARMQEKTEVGPVEVKCKGNFKNKKAMIEIEI